MAAGTMIKAASRDYRAYWGSGLRTMSIRWCHVAQTTQENQRHKGLGD